MQDERWTRAWALLATVCSEALALVLNPTVEFAMRHWVTSDIAVGAAHERSRVTSGVMRSHGRREVCPQYCQPSIA